VVWTAKTWDGGNTSRLSRATQGANEITDWLASSEVV